MNFQNLTTYCDVISPKFRQKWQKHVFLHKMLLGKNRNTKTCTWTNLWVENSFLFLVFRILENLTTYCDVISPKFRQKGQKHVFLHKMLLGNNRNTKICTSTNLGVENSFPLLIFRILENLPTCCDDISPKFSQKKGQNTYSFIKSCWGTIEIRKFVLGLILGWKIHFRS